MSITKFPTHVASDLSADDEMPSIHRTDTDAVFSDDKGQLYVQWGEDEEFNDLWRALTLDEAHDVWASEIGLDGLRADYLAAL